MNTRSLAASLDIDTRPARIGEETAPMRIGPSERPRTPMDFNPLMARAILAQKMADKHMYVPSYDERDRERGF